MKWFDTLSMGSALSGVGDRMKVGFGVPLREELPAEPSLRGAGLDKLCKNSSCQTGPKPLIYFIPAFSWEEGWDPDPGWASLGSLRVYRPLSKALAPSGRCGVRW